VKEIYKLAIKNKMFLAGCAVFLTVLIAAVFAPQIANYPYDQMNVMNALKAPSKDFPLGTDQYGRDLYSRLLYGSQIAIRIGLMVVAIEVSLGIVLGLLAGYYGGKIDVMLSFMTDVTWALPPIVLSLAIVTALGPSLNNVVISTAIISWPSVARMVRAKAQSIKNMPYVEAARALGESDLAIMFKYILPNVMGIVIVLTTLSLPGAILSTTGLSFLGLGSQPPDPDWGVILSEGMTYINQAPWISVFPGIALIWTAMGFNLMGEGLRDILDPRLRT
jgi:peptide/nickel transport system permease protein